MDAKEVVWGKRGRKESLSWGTKGRLSGKSVLIGPSDVAKVLPYQMINFLCFSVRVLAHCCLGNGVFFIFLSCYWFDCPLSHLRKTGLQYLPIPLQEYLFTVLCPLHQMECFLAAEDGHAIWEKTVKTVATDWPVIKTVPPDFESVPPRAGRIESAWYSCHSH